MFVHVLVLIASACCDVIRIRSFKSPEMLLALDRIDVHNPVIIAASEAYISSLPNYCGFASRRHIGDYYNEFYMCGWKLCFDAEVKDLHACAKEEYNAKWELKPVSENTYLLKNDDYCITIENEVRVVAAPCSEFNVSQMFTIEPYKKLPLIESKGKGGGRKTLSQILKDDEEFYRRESLHLY